MAERDHPTAIHSDDYYRVLVEQASVGVFVASPEGQWVAVNPSGHALLGYQSGELLGRPARELVRALDAPRFEQAFAAVLAGASRTDEWLLCRKDGWVFEAELISQPLRDGGVLSLLRDISQRKRSERLTQASEAQLRSVLETAPDIVMTVDRAGTILFINRTAPPVTREQVLGSCCLDYVHPEGRSRVVAAIEHVFRTREIDEYEILGPHDTLGERVWFLVRVGPVIEGEEVIAATFCATDITPRKLAETRRRELFERLQKIASQIPGMVYEFRLQPDGRACMPYASERIRELFGLSPEAVRQDAQALFDLIHPDDQERVTTSMHESAATLTLWRHECRVRFPDGAERWVLGNAVPEREGDGAVLWHGFATDITQERAAAATQAQLEEQLRQAQKMESIGRLAGGVAHDFNNLLTSVMGFTELALSELPADAQVRTPLENVMESAQRGATLTQQLLAFARKRLLRPERVDVAEVLRRMSPMIERLVGEQLSVQLSLSAEPCVVEVDPGSLEQIVMNLVVNARDAMPGTGRLTLETRPTQLDGMAQHHPELEPGEYVVLRVGDTGTGMSDEVRARLFEPFFTTKPQGQGTGLGLAMCHGLVKQAGGSVSVDTQLGHGTSVRILLPRVAGESVQPQPVASTQPRLGGHETLLVVEDEPRILSVARSALAKCGYRVLHAKDGHEALALVAQYDQQIELLVTDVIMPHMSGKELAARLTSLRPGLKVLYCSGYTDDVIASGDGLAFLQKPYTPTALAQRIRDVLDRPE